MARSTKSLLKELRSLVNSNSNKIIQYIEISIATGPYVAISNRVRFSFYQTAFNDALERLKNEKFNEIKIGLTNKPTEIRKPQPVSISGNSALRIALNCVKSQLSKDILENI